VAADGRGRVEVGLNKDLLDRGDITPAARASLRAQARAVDVAEAARDPELVSRANGVYLALLSANGLCAGSPPGGDTFAELLAELSRPAAGAGDVPNT
jgi:hypothetical protein